MSQKPIIGLVVAGILVVLVAISSLWAEKQHERAADLQTHTWQVINAADDLLYDLKDAGTGQRSFAESGDAAVLEAYLAVRDTIPGQLNNLHQLTRDNPVQQHRLDALTPLIEARMALLAQTIALRRQQGSAAALEILNSGRSKQLMDAIRTEMRNFDRDEENLLAQRSAQFHASQSRLANLILLANVLFVLLIMLAIYLVYRESQRRITALGVAAVAFETPESLMITDADEVILQVNEAFTLNTGYSAAEAIGQTPRILKSGYHDAAFYTEMWDTLLRNGTWHGEIWDCRKNGEIYPKMLTIKAVTNASGTVTHYVATHQDISERKAAEAEINKLAFYDALTGLPNRRLLLMRLKQALASSARNGREGALLFIDLDNFKQLNDTRGHDIGDLLLQQVAQRLESCIREGDTVARLGGDEFVVMLEDLSGHAREASALTETVGEKILATLGQPYQLDSKPYRSTPSIGATLFNSEQQTVAELLKKADIAMYQAKKSGRNTLRFFDHAMQETLNARTTLEAELRRALDSQQFQLYYQIQVNSAHHNLGAEALLRWQHPERGLLPPDQFIALAEDTGLILPIGLWVLDTACAQISAWQEMALSRELVLSINVSMKQFHQPDFASQVQDAVQRHAINPALLKLELTENLLLNHIEDNIVTMHALKQIGVQLTLDDFGSGYSSLQNLKRMPLDQIKIDSSFVHDMSSNNRDNTAVHAIIAMAKSLGLSVIAEGVETTEQQQLILDSGCNSYQGYLFGKPMPITPFNEILKTA